MQFGPTGQPVNLGREQRFFTTAQRAALAARDDGCGWVDCDKPASWTEAHHIEHWVDEHGNTDLAVGILLCYFHHMLLHNNGWHIDRHGDAYWLVPPGDIDPNQTPIRLRSVNLLQHTTRP
ncbi:HNH endonuclease signature motif containing protein [Glaciibacter psychrotolerans]